MQICGQHRAKDWVNVCVCVTSELLRAHLSASHCKQLLGHASRCDQRACGFRGCCWCPTPRNPEHARLQSESGPPHGTRDYIIFHAKRAVAFVLPSCVLDIRHDSHHSHLLVCALSACYRNVKYFEYNCYMACDMRSCTGRATAEREPPVRHAKISIYH